MAASTDLIKKYVGLENTLTSINANAISLQDTEIKRNNVILTEVTNPIIAAMRQKDPLFLGLYKEKFYGGSFYDNLKVGNPNEFDLDLILCLPAIMDAKVQCTNQPGFVKVEIKAYNKILERPEPEQVKFKKISMLLDQHNFLSTEKVLKWMEGVITKALNELQKDGNGIFVKIRDINNPEESLVIYTKMSKGAPAFTLNLSGTDSAGAKIELDIDLVPCFQFYADDWPSPTGGYRTNPSKSKSRFLVVPKKPREAHLESFFVLEQYWRLSFQEQEREMITGSDKRVLKPSLKLIKKLRDKHNHKIASYFIKTVYLWTIEKEPVSFWSQSLSIVFMLMLKKYKEYLQSHKIPYYWNDKYNLIGYLKDTTISDIANTVNHIIINIERGLEVPPIDPCVVGKYLLSREDYEKLRADVKLSKKQEKQNIFAETNSLLNSLSQDATDSINRNVPPLMSLNFDPVQVDLHRQYLDNWVEKQRRFEENIMAQINGVKDHSSNNNNEEILNYLKKIDEKLERINSFIEANKYTEVRVSVLENKMRQLELENQNLKSKVDQGNESNSIDKLLGLSLSDVGILQPEVLK